MDKGPITFEHEGQRYSGALEPVQGNGAFQTWHLMIDNYYWGQLRRSNKSWVFDPTPKKEWLAGFANFFGECIASCDTKTKH